MAQQHADAKHPKNKLEECFPIIPSMKEADAKAAEKAAKAAKKAAAAGGGAKAGKEKEKVSNTWHGMCVGACDGVCIEDFCTDYMHLCPRILGCMNVCHMTTMFLCYLYQQTTKRYRNPRRRRRKTCRSSTMHSESRPKRSLPRRNKHSKQIPRATSD